MVPRSLLFTPSIDPHHFDKADEVGADGIILDLEDSVGESQKEKARTQAIAYFALPPKPLFLRAIRINSLSTPHGFKDLLAIIEKKVIPDLILVPKVESAGELQIIDHHLSSLSDRVKLMPIIESHEGLKKIHEIVQSTLRVIAITFGAADYTAQMNIAQDWEALSFARSQIIEAAGCAEIDALDSPYFDITNDAGLIAEIEKDIQFGFMGKLAIHPRQIPFINQGFTPHEEEVKKATKIVEAMKTSHGNAVQIDGKMIDKAVLRSAEKIVMRAEAIKKRSK